MKTIFITGGSTGIGAASVRKFIAEGWNVGFMDINTQAACELVEELNCPDRFTEQRLCQCGHSSLQYHS